MACQRPVSILLVEDDVDSLRALTKLLVRSGFQVLPAGSVAEARTLAGGNPCDLVVCDLGLPDGTGADLLRELRAIHHWKSIAVTGYTLAMRDMRAAGFDAYLCKPIDFTSLLSTVDRLVH